MIFAANGFRLIRTTQLTTVPDLTGFQISELGQHQLRSAVQL